MIIKDNLIKKQIIIGIFIGGIINALIFIISLAAPPISPYQPGETLDPNCSPGDPNCTVLPAVTSLNGLTTTTQTFSVGTSGNDFNIVSSGSIHTFNLPDAGTSSRGLVSTTTQYFSGDKIFMSNIYINGNIGIGTTSPEYKLDVVGNIRALSLTAEINFENLTGDKTLTPGVDKMYQWLNPNGANRIIYLATTTARAGDKFVIRNNDAYYSSYSLQINQDSTILDYVYSQSIKEYIFDGQNWISGNSTTGLDGDYNVSLGYNSIAYNFGTVVGYYVYGYNFGTAVGSNALGYNWGTALGFASRGYNFGSAIGYFADGSDYGSAIGYFADGTDYGVSIGVFSNGSNFGTSSGYNSSGFNYGASFGSFSSGSSYGVAVGYMANGSNSGVSVGFMSSGYNFGSAIGYFSQGFTGGSAVGFEADGSYYGAALGFGAKGMRYGAAVGYQAGYKIETSADRYNSLFGALAGYQLTTGVGNLILGYGAGYHPNYSPTTGSYNILIGYNAWTPNNTTSNFLNIGGLIFGTDLAINYGSVSSGNVGIGTTTPAYKLHVAGSIAQTNALNCALSSDADGQIICTPSSLKYKENIQDLLFDKEKFLSLQPKTFEFKKDLPFKIEGKQVGFIAEEVDQAFPELVRYNQNNEPEGIKYENIAIYIYSVVKDLVNNFTQNIKNSLAQLGIIIENGILKVRELVVNILRVKEIKDLERFEMKDKATGEIYCVWLEYGEFRKVKGGCNEINQNNLNSSISTTSSSIQSSSNDINQPQNNSSQTPENTSTPSSDNSNQTQDNLTNQFFESSSTTTQPSSNEQNQIQDAQNDTYNNQNQSQSNSDNNQPATNESQQ